MRQRLSALSSLAAPPRRHAHDETGSDAANATAADAAAVAVAEPAAEAESAMSTTLPAKAVALAAAPDAAPDAALAVSSSAPALVQRRKGKSLASQGGGSLHLKMLSFGEVVKEAHAMQAKLRVALARSSESAVELFQQWDTDGNGKVTKADF